MTAPSASTVIAGLAGMQGGGWGGGIARAGLDAAAASRNDREKHQGASLFMLAQFPFMSVVRGFDCRTLSPKKE